MHAERVDGYNPLALGRRISGRGRSSKGRRAPSAHTVTYRYAGTLHPDQAVTASGRSRGLQKETRSSNSASPWVAAKVCKAGDLEAIQKSAEALIVKAWQEGRGPDRVTEGRLKRQACLLDRTMYSNLKVESMDTSRKARGNSSPRKRIHG